MEVPKDTLLRSLPLYLHEDVPTYEIYEEVYFQELPSYYQIFAQSLQLPRVTLENTEVRTLVSQGPKENRINLTILGDGYTLSEKEKFFEDAERLTDELFSGATFASYLPLFNVYAVYVSSKESGLTDGPHKVNTAFGLYRDPVGSKRAIMPGSTAALEQALSLAPATDFPIVVANDDYYGGLGGRYAITTRSVESGIVVLRHELGHNFGNVGEEYDGGYVYQGANFSSSATNLKWQQWLKSGSKVYESLFLSGQYVWKNLATGPYSVKFNFPKPDAKGEYQFEIIISTVGWSTPQDVLVELDGVPMQLEGKWTADRSFFSFHLSQNPAPGSHTLTIRENVHDGDNVLAFAEIYAHPGDFEWAPHTYGAFATYNDKGSKVGYRPTHDSCLMRDMLTPHFCSADQENMWVRFLNRVKLIDQLSYDPASRRVNLKVPPLPGLSVRWFSVSVTGVETELLEVADQSEWIASNSLKGRLRAKVSFRTPEVLKYTSGFDMIKDVNL